MTRGWLARLGEIAVRFGRCKRFTAGVALNRINKSPRLGGSVGCREGLTALRAPAGSRSSQAAGSNLDDAATARLLSRRIEMRWPSGRRESSWGIKSRTLRLDLEGANAARRLRPQLFYALQFYNPAGSFSQRAFSTRGNTDKPSGPRKPRGTKPFASVSIQPRGG